MKRKIILILTCLIVFLFPLASCGESGKAKATLITSTATTVVIKVETAEENATLLSVMETLKGETFTYELTGTMVSSINGVQNPADYSSCWMLYTSDADFSNNEWGTTTYEGTTYGSATLGADGLIVASGETYIWVYESFS
ncbi:MAG: DUF4430 domain-containing protein [Clostridia bacterium]|nr:DUF4430 domain-containing protein [Clostridia bacterium]